MVLKQLLQCNSTATDAPHRALLACHSLLSCVPPRSRVSILVCLQLCLTHLTGVLQAQADCSVATQMYLDAALKFLLAAAAIELFDAKQASVVYRETADMLE